MKERLIRRYSNRKMYDVLKSRYVSLSELAEIVKSGEQIRVTNKSGEKDYTAQILRQIILEEGKRSDEYSVSILHDWARHGNLFFENQWKVMRSGLENWFKKNSDKWIITAKHDELKSLKEKIDTLEKQIDKLNKNNN